MLTKSDLKEIEKIMDDKLEKRLSFLPTKDEFYSKMDQVMGELQTIRDEISMGSHRISDHEDRIIVLEQKAGVAAS